MAKELVFGARKNDNLNWEQANIFPNITSITTTTATGRKRCLLKWNKATSLQWLETDGLAEKERGKKEQKECRTGEVELPLSKFLEEWGRNAGATNQGGAKYLSGC